MWILILIGKILLWILLALIILLLLILFFPVSYKLKASKSGTELFAKGKVSWLFGFIRILFDFPKSKEIKIKILFFQLNKKKTKNEKVKKAKTRKNKDTKTKEKNKTTKHKNHEVQGVNLALLDDSENELQATSLVDADNKGSNPNTADYYEEKRIKGAYLKENLTEEYVKESNAKEENATDAFTTSEGGKEDSGKEKKQNIFEKIKATIEKIRYTIKSLYDKIIHIKEEYEFYKKLWDEPVTRSFLTDSFFRVFKVVRRIFPKKVQVNAHIGTGACDTTGYMMAAYGIVTSIVPKNYSISLEPDFDQTTVEGNLSVKGHITVFHILICGIQLIFDKRLRELNRKIKAHKEKNKHVQNSTGTE